MEEMIAGMPESALEIDLETVKGRAVKGVVALTGRTFILQIISFLGFFILTVFLNQAEIGLFFAVSELIAILGYFSDIGLAAALIQKKEKPKLADIRSTFTIQQALVLTLVILVFLLTPWLRGFYNISQSGIWLLWALTVGFFLASLKTIPSVLLERKLRFDLLVVVEIVESLLFYGLAVFLAWQGFGVTSYAWAVLARGFVGVILIYLLSPWKIGFAFEKDSLKHLLRFGVPYQTNSFLAVIKDRLMNVFLWKIIGATGVGILGWAQKWAQMPLRFVMDAVIKVTFPAYARMQDDKKELTRAIEKTLFFITLLVFPLVIGLCLVARPLVMIIPRYSKWEIAILALYLYAINSLWGAVTTPLTNALTAIGKIKTVFKLMVMWTILTWIFFPLLALKFGFNGVAAASALVAFSSVVAIWITKQHIKFNFIGSIIKPLIASLIMAVVVFLFESFLAKGLFGLIFSIILGGLVYFGVIYLMVGQQLIIDSQKLIYAIKKKI
ncbi:MAG TPA: oligosaccharide flippase family protein [Patescibacteria group bacterium]|nr:oligosaccharide flippase family protein [Patescibacteria group bacterium]